MLVPCHLEVGFVLDDIQKIVAHFRCLSLILFFKIHTCVTLALVRAAKKIEKASGSIEDCPFFLFSIVQIEFEGINFYPFY